jgi:hypothetical protein
MGSRLEVKRLGQILFWLGLCSCSAPALSHARPAANKVVVSSDNRLLWNGLEIDRPTLIRYLHVISILNPVPDLFVDYWSGANCGIVRNVFRTVALTTDDRIFFGDTNLDLPAGRGCSVPLHRRVFGSERYGWETVYYLARPR